VVLSLQLGCKSFGNNMKDFLKEVLHEFQTPFENSVLVFSLILLIILLAPVLLKRLRIPGIIGLIISGTLIGPHGLYLIEQNSAVRLFSTIGLLYIMFIAGLELDLGEFRKNKSKSLVFGLLTFILPISIGFPVCYYLLDYAFNASLLTASMFATHTLIAYPIVSRLGISKNEAVAVTVGGTIFTDTAVLVVLAVISGSAAGGSTNQLWMRLGISFAIFLLLVVFAVPRIAAWFFKRLEDEKNAHFIFVLSIVFICAFIAELSGLEPIIGAFAAGLTLNRLIPHTSSLMNRIEFVGNSLFIPFFLISVGMLIDVRVLTHGPQALIVAAALTIVALTGKWLAARLTSIIFRYTRAQRKLIFGLSSAHAAATLAVILVGFNLEIIDENILNGTIILILVTCLVASFITEDAGKKLVLQLDEEEPELGTDRGQRILVPISNPATMERLIDFAITMKDAKNFSPIVGLTIVEDDDKAQGKILQARKMLEKAITHAAAADQKIEITATIDQNVTNGIKRVTRETFVTDIIMGWPSKTKLVDLIFGKTFDSVVNQTYQTVFITRFTLPLNVHQAMHLLCPHLVEREHGFHKWMEAVLRTATRLSLKVHVHSTQETFEEIEAHVRKYKVTIPVDFKECRDISNLSKFGRMVHTSDIIVLASARKGRLSYTPFLDVLPGKMIKAFQDNSLIFVYPEIETGETLSSFTQEAESGLLEKGINMLRGARNIFSKE
jgi:Kef-type K+ transport system membrane component KefB